MSWKRVARIAGVGVFWSWNLVFLALIFFGLVPAVMVALVVDAVRGELPWEMVATACLICALPIVSVVAVVRGGRPRADLPHLRASLDPVAVFYGLEAPLGLLCLARIFLVRELNPGLTQVLASFFLGASFFAMELWGGTARRRWARLAQLGGHTVGLAVTAYASVLSAFLVFPAVIGFLREAVRFAWVPELGRALLHNPDAALLFLFIGVPLLALGAALFVGTPLVMPVLYVRSFLRVLRAHRPALGRLALAPVAAAVVGSVALFAWLNRQPQVAAFEALAAPPRDDAARARLLARKDELRAGLVNAYLAPYRHLGARGDALEVARLYRDDLGLSQSSASRVQAAFEGLAAPLFYDGPSFGDDGRRAAELYAAFFDAPIQKREREAVLRAIATTYSSTDREAGLLDVGQQRVLLAAQEVNIDEQGPVAEIEIHDRWENQTREQQEVVLGFTLPEEAAVTGLWLGSSDDRAARVAAVVSPRGAARAVYRAEVQRRLDPALLEQIGPRQYRLRIFPVPARLAADLAPVPFHVWLTYATPPVYGGWPMPELTERRNGFWDRRTTRTIHAETGGLHGFRIPGDGPEVWVGRLPASRSLSAPALAVPIGGGRLLRREARAAGAGTAACGRRLAVVVDRSLSMGAHERALRAELDAVARLGATNDVDIYLGSSPSRGEPARLVHGAAGAGAMPLVFFGGGSLADMLAGVDALAAGQRYDAMLVLTDDGGLDLVKDNRPPAAVGAPLWLVHVGGAYSTGYDDGVLARLEQSRGGVAGSVTEALDRQAALAEPQVISAGAGYVWTMEAAPPGQKEGDGLLEQLAARQLILAKTRALPAEPAQRLAMLDEIHTLAVRHRVVSSYSSMIALVSDVQKRALERAEHGDARFEREVEPETRSISQPSSPFGLAATPEPHEWVLIGLAAAALLAAARRHRRRLIA
jgi:putative PEP-CTERM system integral membrane protein